MATYVHENQREYRLKQNVLCKQSVVKKLQKRRAFDNSKCMEPIKLVYEYEVPVVFAHSIARADKHL